MSSGIFCCDNLNSFSTDSIIKIANEKIKLFDCDSDDEGEFSRDTEILNQKICLDKPFTPEDVIHYFSLVKKNINVFRAGIGSKRSAPDKSAWTCYRGQIFNFLRYISWNVGKFEEPLQQVIIKEVVNLITFTGRLSMLEDFDPNIFISSSESQSPSRHYLHGCLDIWLISFHIISEYSLKTNIKVELLSDANSSHDLRTKFLECILADLIYISLQKFKAVKDPRMIISVKPYICPCHKVFFSIIKTLAEKDTAILNIHPFWFYYNAVIDSFSEENFKENRNNDSLNTYKRIPNHFKSIDNLNIANIWLMSNLMELLNVSKETTLDQDICNSIGFTHSCVPLIQDFKSSGFTDSETIEIALQLCYNAFKRCAICIDIPVLFVECYLRMVTSSNPPGSVFYSLPKTSNQWSLKLRTLFERGSASEWEDKILGLLCLLLERVISKLSSTSSLRSLQIWQKFKSDLFAVFSTHSLDNLNDNQLYKVFTILIVCCSSSGPELYQDFVSKFREISNSITSRSIHSKKTKLVFQWIICTALMLPDDRDMNRLVLVGTDLFDKLTDVYSKLSDADSNAKESCSELVLLYFEEIIYLSDIKVESLGTCSPIPGSIDKVFGRLSDRDLFNMIAAITSFLRSVRNHLSSILEPPYKHGFGPFISNILRTLSKLVQAQYAKGKIDSTCLCEIASVLTYLGYVKDPGRLNSAEFRHNFIHFTCNFRVDLKLRETFCDFLFRDNEKVILKEMHDYWPDLAEQFLRSDEAGQLRLKTVLMKVSVFISSNEPNPIEDIFLPKLTEIVHKAISSSSVLKLFKLLEIFTSLLPELRNKLVTTIAQRIHEMELQGHKNTAEIKEALRRLYHSSGKR